MGRRLSPADLQRIKDEIRARAGDGVQKTMRCGHQDWVFKSLDPAQHDCWVCIRAEDKRTQPK